MQSVSIFEQKTDVHTAPLADFLCALRERYPHILLLVDERVYQAHSHLWDSSTCFVVPSGEKSKSLASTKRVIDFLLSHQADRHSFLLAVGGGVVTDLAGFVASVYMRGISFGFVPTTILAMVDASLGGKNGINIGLYKNMVGTTTQPSFLLFDYTLLSSLPKRYWIDGFAEVIKHAILFDPTLFGLLEEGGINRFMQDPALLRSVVETNVRLKYQIVSKDPYEKKERKLLNLGHTIAHGLEKKARLSHGSAVAIGIAIVATLSRILVDGKDELRIKHLLEQYHLPTSSPIAMCDVWDIILKDKKRKANVITEILIPQIGSPLLIDFPIREYQAHLLKV